MKAPVSFLLPLSIAIGILVPARGFGTSPSVDRKEFVRASAAAVAGTLLSGGVLQSSPALAEANDKQVNLPDDQLKEIVRNDVVNNQFLCNGKLTRSIYDESATFTDEIDTYQMDQWIKGTQKLFVGENSQVRLVGDIDVTKEAVTFRFDEDLQFRIPLRPTVALTGKVVLARDPNTGLITSYKEFWDQDVSTVLKSAKFNFKI